MAVSKMLPTFLRRCTPSLTQSVNQSVRGLVSSQLRCLSLQTMKISLPQQTHLKVSSSHRFLHIKSVLYQEQTAESSNESTNIKASSDHIVCISQMAWATTIDDVLDFFKDCDILGVHIIYKTNGLASGKCIVELASEDDLNKALSQNSASMGERNIEVVSVDRQFMDTLMRNYGVPQNKKLTDPVLKLKGLPRGCTIGSVKRFLEGYNLAPNGITLSGVGRGFLAFVQFETVEEAERALEERQSQYLGQRFINVFKSSLDETTKYQAESEQISQDLRLNETPHNSVANNDRPNRRAMFTSRSAVFSSQNSAIREPRERSYLQSLTGHSVQMRGLPYPCTEEDIRQFFAPLEIKACEFERYGQSERMSGWARADFASHEDAVEAMKKDKEYIRNRYVDLFLRSE